MEYILETNGLEKRYGHFKAINNLNMHIPKGSIYGLVGKMELEKLHLSEFFVVCKNQHLVHILFMEFQIIIKQLWNLEKE